MTWGRAFLYYLRFGFGTTFTGLGGFGFIDLYIHASEIDGPNVELRWVAGPSQDTTHRRIGLRPCGLAGVVDVLDDRFLVPAHGLVAIDGDRVLQQIVVHVDDFAHVHNLALLDH